MEKWLIINNDIDFNSISKDLNISPIMGKILANRDIKDGDAAKRFLYSGKEELYSPSLMKDLVKAAKIIESNIKDGKNIRIVGDYDVDGITSVYILYTSLKELGANIDYVIPNRIKDGYGINKDMIKSAKDEGIDTIITCDNGIAAVEEMEYGKELGMTMIITDHHDFPFIEEDGVREYIDPPADAIVNPKNPKCEYPFDKLCGAGVAYKLIEYIWIDLFNRPKDIIQKQLEYVAIATICDVVDLKDENRIIVKEGLELLNNTKNKGLIALKEVMELNSQIQVYHIGFVIGPAINASGRLDSPYKALDLLLTEDEIYAKRLAKELKDLNDERKDMTENSVKNIIEEIEGTELINDDIIIVYDPTIHQSVAGIVAGRIKDRFHRPTIVLTDGEDGVKGSGRSISSYNIFEGLTASKELLNKFGGHPMAAGLSLNKENVKYLREDMNKKSDLNEDDLAKKYYIDMGLPIEYINYKFIEDLKIIEPFGLGNPKPIFGGKDLTINRMYKLGKNQNVLKFDFQSDKGSFIEGIMFNDVDVFEQDIVDEYGNEQLEKLYTGTGTGINIDIIYSPSINEYMGRTNLQLIVENYRI